MEQKIRSFDEGQLVVLEANINGLMITRPYTLISVSENKDFYEITVKHEKFEIFSP
ncbi:FAD-binding oxidoreductase [Candidatus Coxiella mudrowiae]|uniref:FAD-binding oxidoreductase n=1 Tax=Candidatus Coxiella mudrowiae TaxID=2054173 RepID=UPI0012FF1DBF